MEDKVQRDETLYRAIKRSKPEWLDEGRPTPAMFKDANGNSVDRGDNRPLTEVVCFMKNGVFANRLKGVVSLNAGRCIDIGTKVEAAPSETNPYHANVFINEDDKYGNLQALMLADISEVVYEDPSMKWVYIVNSKNK